MACLTEIEQDPCEHLDDPCVKGLIESFGFNRKTAKFIWWLIKVFRCIFNESKSEYQVEVSMAPLGCVRDESGNLLGKVIATRTVDEQAGNSEWVNMLYPISGGPPSEYEGSWEDCEPNGKWENGPC